MRSRICRKTRKILEIAYHDFADALGKDLLRKIFPHYDWSHLDINEDEEADQPVVPDEVLMSEDPNVTYHRSRFHGVSCMYAVADGHAFVFVADNDHGPVMERRAMLSWGSHALRLKRTIAILRAKIASSPIPDAGASQAKVRPCEKTPASSDLLSIITVRRRVCGRWSLVPTRPIEHGFLLS